MLYDKSQNTARSLRRQGVKEGELVAINLRSCPEWLYVTFGTMMAGAIPVTTAFVYKDGSDVVEVMKRLKRCSMLIMDPGQEGENWRVITKLIDSNNGRGEVKSKQMPYLRYLIMHDPMKYVSNLAYKRLDGVISERNDEIELPAITEDDIAILLQTSGSTSVAKLVTHTHKSILLPCKVRYCVWFSPGHVIYNDRPFTWVGGFPFSCLIGQKRVTLSGFRTLPDNSIAEMIEVISREKCSIVLAMPPLLHAIIQQKDKLPADWPVEVILTGGQPLTKSVASSVGKVCKSLCCGYGATEFIIMTSMLVDDPNNFEEFSSGSVVQGPGLEVKIVDEEEKIVPVNCRGEIYLRSPGMFKGYFNDTEKTAKAKSEDGWYKTDDMAKMNAEGMFFIDGRKSNMIISGGINVIPEVMERVLRSCPGVEFVVVVPIPDDVSYQLLCACVIPKPKSGLTVEQLKHFCKEIYTDQQGLFTVLPNFFLLLDKFPETSTGKTSRLELAKYATEIIKG